MNKPIIDNAKVMAKGQITLPKDIRKSLNIETGDRVTLICKDNIVILMNSKEYAKKILNDNDITNIIDNIKISKTQPEGDIL